MMLKRVVEVFGQNGIPYALAGGYAVSLHGAVRGTVDIDILVYLDEENLTRVESAMTSLGLASRIPVKAKEIAGFREEYINNRNLKAWTFVNPNLPTEIIDIIILYDLKDFKVESRKTVFGKVNIVSLEGLIRMKREAGRAQDLADIEALEKIRGS